MDCPARKQNRLENYNYSENGAYFITICTENRRNILSTISVGADIIRPQPRIVLTQYGKIVAEAISNISSCYPSVAVDKYVIMPNHVHLLLSFSPDAGRIISAPTLSVVIGQMKRWCSKQIGQPIWQKSFHDHVIRSQQDYDEIWSYIENNPKQWELDKYHTI